MLIIKGQGFVGRATERFLKYHTDIDTIEFDDPPKGIRSDNFARAQWCVICVPTPLGNDGLNDDETVFKAIRNAELNYFSGTYIVRSTVSLNTIVKLKTALGSRLIVWPEFIRANNWEEDAVDPDIVVLGGTQAQNFEKLFGIMPRTRVFVTGELEAMAMKLAANTFLAAKVVFANQLRDLCIGYGANYDHVSLILRNDPRLGSTHWTVPGPDGSLGFGGHCFPKDSTTYKTELQNCQIDATMLEAMLKINQRLRNDN